jgi:hypothetical protein
MTNQPAVAQAPDANTPPKAVQRAPESQARRAARPNIPNIVDPIRDALLKVAPFLVLATIAAALLGRRSSKRRDKTKASLQASWISLAKLLLGLFLQRRTRNAPPQPTDHWHSSGPAPEDIPYEPRTRVEPTLSVPPSAWTLALVRALEWKRFEELVQGFWKAKGHSAELTSTGADGGVDVMIYGLDGHLLAVAQCKQYRSGPVGVAVARELWGVVHHFQAQMGILYGLSGFTPDARAFAHQKHLQLITGEQFFEQLSALPADQQKALLDHVCRGDYLTPTCPSCDTKMVRKTGPRGDFWGCLSYPRCQRTLHFATRAG